MNFSIDACTYTLLKTNRAQDKSILGCGIKYLIPIYQRPYSWADLQIKKFISDIFISYFGTEHHSINEPMFIGTMQLSAVNNKNEQDIIDGQQRISTFLILLKVISLRFSNSESAKCIYFNWLTTEVNSGKQQEKLESLLRINSYDELLNSKEGHLNRYINNAIIISHVINDEINKRPVLNFNIDKFLNHLFSNIYFVVIETNASLSKTLQIFDSINTTGLDLNASDKFKIRMYEYLNQDGENDSIFNEISKLYEKIDSKNKEAGEEITDIRGILTIYQFYLISKYDLPNTLYEFGVDTFYDRLFETIFGITKWEHFKNNVENGKIKLCLKELDSIIDERYDWNKRWVNLDYNDAMTIGLVYHWKRWSRYAKFWPFTFIFLHIYKNDPDKYNKLFNFSNKLIKIYLLYSIVYQKSVNRIKGSFNNKVLNLIIRGNYESLIDFLTTKLHKESEWEKERFKTIINGDIVYSGKVKNILCRLSAILEENYNTSSPTEIQKVIEKIYLTNIDIEHIQSYNDEDISERELIKAKWKENLNSIGNLVILERALNRSIGNNEDKKLENYRKSKFTIVNSSLVKQYNNWNLERCIIRKNNETEKLISFFLD